MRSATLALVVAAIIVNASTLAAEWKFGGHAKYQYTVTDYRGDDVNSVLADVPAHDHDVDLRLKAEGTSGAWDFAAHYELLAASGDTLAARRRAASFPLVRAGTVTGLPDDRRRLFDLTETITDRPHSAAVQRLDRFAVGHTTPESVVRFGRQAITWGNGLVFYPLDFVNPFSPIAVDKEYKTGDDMLYAQWIRPNGGDLQTIVVPGRNVVTHDIESDESTYAAKVRLRYGTFDLDVVGARHIGDNILGLGIVKSIGGAVWRFDTSYTDASARNAWSFVTNVDYSWIWGGKNMYGYVEYFRNGFGEIDRARYATPNPDLARRIERGELYTLAQDYAALGLQVELHPLVNVYTNVIWNLNDGSRFLQVRGVYDWRQNVQLMAGVNLPYGSRGDEFGGIPIAGTGLFAAPGRSLFVRAGYYF